MYCGQQREREEKELDTARHVPWLESIYTKGRSERPQRQRLRPERRSRGPRGQSRAPGGHRAKDAKSWHFLASYAPLRSGGLDC